jgi:hypothetical protein
MFRLVLFTYSPLRVTELHHALTVPDNSDAEFSPSNELFSVKLIHGIAKRIVHCGGNFLEVNGPSGTYLPWSALLEHFG